MKLYEEIAFPNDWMAIIRVTSQDGREFEIRVETPKGDLENTIFNRMVLVLLF
jgi:hypothetical protein